MLCGFEFEVPLATGEDIYVEVFPFCVLTSMYR